jgi:hypothetical protein
MCDRLRTEQNVYRNSCLTTKLVFTVFLLVSTVFCIVCTVFFVLFHLRVSIVILICFACTSVRTTATE